MLCNIHRLSRDSIYPALPYNKSEAHSAERETYAVIFGTVQYHSTNCL